MLHLTVEAGFGEVEDTLKELYQLAMHLGIAVESTINNIQVTAFPYEITGLRLLRAQYDAGVECQEEKRKQADNDR